MKPYSLDHKVPLFQDLNEVDKKTNEEMKRVNFKDWAIKLLTIGALWALYERLGKPVSKLSDMIPAKVNSDHVMGHRHPGGSLGAVENINDILPYNAMSKNMLKFAFTRSAENLQKISDQARTSIRLLIAQAKLEGMSSKDLAERLRKTFKNLDRDWRRVAVTESASIVMNGYIMSQGEGQKVVGQSRPDCCPWCKSMIQGKIFTVTHEPPQNASDPKWDDFIWSGKSNIMRTRHAKAANGVIRVSGELWKPCIPLHPHCRCTWVAYNPRFHEIGPGGTLRVKGS
jgi:hypothetical protein